MMRRSLTITILALAMLLVGLAPVYAAAVGDIPPEILREFEKEKPLAQQDIDSFLAMWPEMISTQGTPTQAQVQALYKKHGFSEIRGTLVTMKIVNAFTINQVGPDNKVRAVQMLESMNMPKVLIPSNAEQALVAKNAEKIRALPGMSPAQ